MYLVTNAIYEDMAKHLLEAIGDSSYFSGVVEFSCLDDLLQDVECRIVASLFIYRSPISSPEYNGETISNIVPVWLECYIIVDSEEKINDFDLEELKYYICKCQ